LTLPLFLHLVQGALHRTPWAQNSIYQLILPFTTS
jgi:hypothetical protein